MFLNQYKKIRIYYGIYSKYVGHRIIIVLGLGLMAGIMDSFGITMLFPILELFDTGHEENYSKYTAFFVHLATWFGIQNSLNGVLVLIAFVFIIKALFKFFESAFLVNLKSDMRHELKIRLFKQYSKMDYLYYCKKNSGYFINIVNTQSDSMVSSFENYKKYLSTLMTIMIYFSFAFIINWKFALMAVFFGFVILMLFRKINHYVKALSRKSVAEQGRLNNLIIQTMHGFKYIVSTGETHALLNKINRSLIDLIHYVRSRDIASAFTTATREPISVILLISIIIFQVTFFDSKIGTMFVSLILLHRAMGQVMSLQQSWQGLMGNIGSLEIVEKEFDRLADYQKKDGFKKISNLNEGIILDNIYFSYSNDQRFALYDLSIDIPINKTIALVGESGSGKSTLVDLLTLLLEPAQGQLKIDGIEHNEIERESWRQLIGYVSQDTVIFDDTIANNICMWRGEYDKDHELRNRIEEAAKMALADEFINSLPDGYQTCVGDNGLKLSGGQKQRLFIARELFKKPQLLILDEATSALDAETENFIKSSIDSLKGHATIVIIAHRLATIKDVDYIYVLNQGKIIQQGTYEELLLDKRDEFNKMVTLQAL